jgi:predicted MFS family arabinose efflux permease
MLGVGTLGNVASSLPLSWAVTAFGWRETVLGLAAITGAVALAILLLVRDPEKLDDARGGSMLELLKMPVLWPILAMMVVCYAPIAGLRGLWIGPYFADVHGAGQAEIAQVSLWVGLAMVAGNFAYGPLDRWLGRRKLVVVVGNAVTLACLVALWWFAAAPPLVVTAILVAAGFFGATFPIVLAHGRSFVPAHLTGRGVTLLNLFGIAQIVTGRLHAATEAVTPAAPFQSVFIFFAVATAIGLFVYLWSQDRPH